MAFRYIANVVLVSMSLAACQAWAQPSNRDPASSWELEGEYEFILDYQADFALNKRVRDDRLRLDQEFQLRLSYRPGQRVSSLIEAKVLGESELYREKSGKTSLFWLERGETWFRVEDLWAQNLSLQLGRQNFEEPRRWWWDDDLDAARLRYRSSPWHLELGVARELLPTSTLEGFIDPDEKDILRVLGRAEWRYHENHRAALFSLYQNDRSKSQPVGFLFRRDREDPSDANLFWAGVRAMGETAEASFGQFSYWADTAIVVGKETLLELEDAPGRRNRVAARIRRSIGGWAFDLGARWATEIALRPIFILGYALGSGDPSPQGGSDRAFRQTGLQSNDEEFRTYGELLRPELSNLAIPVAAVQFPVLSNSHVELAYRHFRQVHAAPFLRDARLETDPNGRDKNIGQEWMVFFGVKEWKNAEAELVGAVFRAGKAFGALSGEKAYSLFLKVTFEF